MKSNIQNIILFSTIEVFIFVMKVQFNFDALNICLIFRVQWFRDFWNLWKKFKKSYIISQIVILALFGENMPLQTCLLHATLVPLLIKIGFLTNQNSSKSKRLDFKYWLQKTKWSSKFSNAKQSFQIVKKTC